MYIIIAKTEAKINSEFLKIGFRRKSSGVVGMYHINCGYFS